MRMEISTLWWCILAGCLQLATCKNDESTEIRDSQESSQNGASEATTPIDPSNLEPLFLSPMIETCDYDTAQNKSRVQYFRQYGINSSAYSGYITVNKTTKNNMFFLLIEAEENATTAPLMLWTQGGPGLSALFGLFLQNGPVQIKYPTNVSRRQPTIQQNMSVLYLDAPVGAGFSFSNTSSYPAQMEDVIIDIVEFMKQFLQLFSQYKKREFYVAGDSYAARYSVMLAEKMLKEKSLLDLDLQGVIGGVGFLAPVLQLADSSDFLYQVSMLNFQGYTFLKDHFKNMSIIFPQNSTIALGMLLSTIFTSETQKTLFQNLTQYDDHASPLYTKRPLDMYACVGYVNDTNFKIAIHAGANASVQFANPHLLYRFASDWLVDVKDSLEYVLNNTRVLLYSGQLDVLFPARNMQLYLEMFNWTESDAYRTADRRAWQPYSKYYGSAGYTKTAGNFTFAVLLGMSHYAGYDKPEEVYYMMMQFVNKELAFQLRDA